MYYHLSYNKDIKELSPNIPRKINPLRENNKIKRICFSDNIDKCLSSINPCFNHNIYVYVPINLNYKYLKKAKIKDVIDAKKNNEFWYLENVSVKCIGIIKVLDEIKSERFHNYKGFFNVFHYKYKWIKKITT